MMLKLNVVGAMTHVVSSDRPMWRTAKSGCLPDGGGLQSPCSPPPFNIARSSTISETSSRSAYDLDQCQEASTKRLHRGLILILHRRPPSAADRLIGRAGFREHMIMIPSDSPSVAAVCPHFNPLDPAHLSNPYPAYAEFRRETPVFYSAEYDLWFVTRYADVVAAVRQPHIFSSVGSVQATAELCPAAQAILENSIGAATMMVSSDEPVHTRIRSVLNKAFTPQRISQLEPRIREIAGGLINAFVADGHADLVAQFALPLPGLVICDLFGIPRADLPQIKRWADDWMTLLSVAVPEEQQIVYARSMVAFQDYLRAQLLERQHHPRQDLLTVMLPVEHGGTSALTMQEALYNAMAVTVAGYETTTSLIANAMTILFNHPKQYRQLCENPELMANAVEELLRMDTSIQGLFRTTTQAVELGEVTIPANVRVFLLYGSANHDSAQFPDPERFDITRPNARGHLTFSRGIHVCIGAALARLEIRIAVELLLQQLPNLRPAVAAQPQRFEHFWLRGYTSLPVEWDRG
ncbi:MAG TPA: cytochrome P450 [Archangium sp.]|nr:cytochrome P450 [Archangium sp.]